MFRTQFEVPQILRIRYHIRAISIMKKQACLMVHLRTQLEVFQTCLMIYLRTQLSEVLQIGRITCLMA